MVKWGWMTCLAAIVVHLVVCGIQNNFGFLYIYILDELGSGGRAKSAWVGSLCIGIGFIIGPLVTASCDRVGCRVTGIVGSLVGVAGLVCSSFSRNVYLLYATYGVAMGVGCGACYITTMKALSLWFNRRLALVNSLAIAGDFIGNLVMAPCLQRMLATFGLAGTFRLLAGIFSINSLMAVLYRMPEKATEKNIMVETKSNTTSFDFTVFKHKPYVFFVIGSNIFSIAFSITYVHVPSFAKEEGIPERKTALLIGIDALSGLASVLCFSKIVDCFNNSHLQFYQLSILGIGLVQTFIAAAKTFPSFMVLMVFHGINTAIFAPLRPVLAEDILGKDRASEGVGVLFGTLGFAYIAGPPLAGWIYDMTHSYPVVFFVGGGLCVMASCILFLIPLLQEPIHKRKASRFGNQSRSLIMDDSSKSYQERTPDCDSTQAKKCCQMCMCEGNPARETDV